MALTRVKTWSVDCRFLPAVSNPNDWLRHNAYQVKEIHKAFGWTVVGSSDSVAADSITIGTYYTDRWTAASKVVMVNGSGAHSWIVMENQSLYSHFQYCIDMISDINRYICSMYISPTGQFSGGSTTARPTATDEAANLSGGAFLSSPGSTVADAYLVGMHSSDGQCTRIFKMSPALGAFDGPGCAALFFDVVENAPGWWTEKYVVPGLFGGSGVNSKFSVANYMNASGLRCLVNSTTLRSMRCTCEGLAANPLCNLLPGSNYGGDLSAFPVGLCIDATAQRGFMGNLYDAYWIDPNMVNATVIPGTGGPWDWIKIGDAIWGFGGSAPAWTYNPYS